MIDLEKLQREIEQAGRGDAVCQVGDELCVIDRETGALSSTLPAPLRALVDAHVPDPAPELPTLAGVDGERAFLRNVKSIADQLQTFVATPNAGITLAVLVPIVKLVARVQLYQIKQQLAARLNSPAQIPDDDKRPDRKRGRG